MRKTCSICGSEMALEKIDATGSGGPLKLAVSGMPAGKCKRGHAVPAEDDFMLWLIRELKSRADGLPAGSEQGMPLFRKYLCRCGKELARKSERTRTFPFELSYEGLPAFRAELEIPVYKCNGCSEEIARSHKAIRGHVGESVARVHDAAGFPHYG